MTDADGDSASAAVDLGANGVFRFEDDGPRAGLAEEAPRLGATVDESLVSLGGVGTDGVASATLSAADVQAQFNPAFGADGAGSIGYSLALTGTNVVSGLYAVDPAAANGRVPPSCSIRWVTSSPAARWGGLLHPDYQPEHRGSDPGPAGQRLARRHHQCG
ncbi:DUF5801 repeats-in-toxin domain-containing protein [Aeromonas hydrophila]|uniref:DUF5801 repeats-in-toxin domain-containing protein n=1 Tax=Aeromonas hydrophila TaxID=644 RepID=UPI00187D5136|nr:DUF5801 repeats-in-toxin domain-containing protein [Aeromonas hydrophila]